MKLVLIREMSFGGHLGSSFALINISMSKNIYEKYKKYNKANDIHKILLR